MLTVFDVAATFTGALGGALLALRRRFVVTGVLALAICSGFGGGILRDVVLGALPAAPIADYHYVLVAVIAAGIVVFFSRFAGRIQPAFFLVDALSVGLFGAVGSQKALTFHLAGISAVLVGTLNAIGGGIVRDIISGATPDAVLPGLPDASAGMVGCTLFVVEVAGFGLEPVVAGVVSVTVTIAIQVVGVRRGWVVPPAADVRWSRLSPTRWTARRRPPEPDKELAGDQAGPKRDIGD